MSERVQLGVRRAAWLVLGLWVGCGGGGATRLSRAQLLDPTTCRSCHTTHYADWAASMHAYASDDPVFRAMNARGQRETDGGLGSFCINCHAPMALREGASTDGLNLDAVPQALHGVTCFFCHSVASVQADHDAPFTLSGDGGLVGEYGDPISSAPHGAAYSPLLDRSRAESSAMCGACHDVVNGHGTRIERTFAEWKASAFSATPGGTTCAGCHMAQSAVPEAIAQVPGAPLRRTHSHGFPGVDSRLDDDPSRVGQLQLISSFLDSTLQGAVCVEQLGQGATVKVILDNVAGGHGFPSGAAQDRRAWVEVEASLDGGALYRSGAVPDGGSVADLQDPDLWQMRECMRDASQKPVHMFWEAASAQDSELPALPTFDANDPAYYSTHVAAPFPRAALLPGVPDRVEVRVHLMPIGRDVLDDLVASGDLAPAVRDRMAALDVGAPLVWTPATATETVLDARTGGVYTCASPQGLNVNAATTPVSSDANCAP